MPVGHILPMFIVIHREVLTAHLSLFLIFLSVLLSLLWLRRHLPLKYRTVHDLLWCLELLIIMYSLSWQTAAVGASPKLDTKSPRRISQGLWSQMLSFFIFPTMSSVFANWSNQIASNLTIAVRSIAHITIHPAIWLSLFTFYHQVYIKDPCQPFSFHSMFYFSLFVHVFCVCVGVFLVYIASVCGV